MIEKNLEEKVFIENVVSIFILNSVTEQNSIKGND